MNGIAYIKGISKGPEGPAAISSIICDNWGRVLKKDSLFIGDASALKAAFTALLSGIEAAIEVGITSLKIFADNEILTRTMTGGLNPKEEDINELISDIKSVSSVIFVEYIHIHPSRNRDAEALAIAALDQGLQNSESDKDTKHHASAKHPLPQDKTKHEASAQTEKTERIQSSAPPKTENKQPGPQKAAVNAFRRSMIFDDIAKVPEIEKPATKQECPDLCPEEREEQQISAGGVVYKKEGSKIMVCLISKKNNRIWAFPKGRVQAGEDLKDTARREIAEETGHLTQVTDILEEISYYFYVKEENVLYHKTVYFFLMPILEENFCDPDGEADSIAWMPIGEAYRKLTYINEKDVLRKAQKILSQAH